MRVKNFLLLCSVATLSQWGMAESRISESDRPQTAASEHQAKGAASTTHESSSGTTHQSSAPTGSKQTRGAQSSGTAPSTLANAGNSNPESLGMVYAILNFCSQVDPADSASFQQQWTNIVNGVSTTQLASIQGGSTYQQGYNLVLGMLNKLPHQTAVAGCSNGALEWNGGTPNDGGSFGGSSSGGNSTDGKHRTTTGRTMERERP